MKRKIALNVVLVGIVALATSGCGKSTGTGSSTTAANDAAAAHAGWWCNEHGVPEEVCARCDTKLVTEFKAKGDWCAEHDRPDSQCFIHHPEKQAEFAALYEAKYGKAPPQTEEEDSSDEEHEHEHAQVQAQRHDHDHPSPAAQR